MEHKQPEDDVEEFLSPAPTGAQQVNVRLRTHYVQSLNHAVAHTGRSRSRVVEHGVRIVWLLLQAKTHPTTLPKLQTYIRSFGFSIEPLAASGFKGPGQR